MDPKKQLLRNFLSLLGIICLLPAGPGMIQAAETESEAAYSPQGADTCLMCHGQGSQFQVVPIFMTKHGSRTDPEAPFANLQCESCHGPSNEHFAGMMRGQIIAPQITFGTDSEASVEDQNGACLGCHQDHASFGWFGSAHEGSGVACVSCHQIHVSRDPVFEPLTQQETCFQCHTDKRSDTVRASSHPLRFGSMDCSDCHNVHEGSGDFLLSKGTVNDTCYACHAEKRGPMLWEHAPVTEDCSLCHRPHGSNHPALLTQRPPLLCQQCHSRAGHPSVAYTSDEIDDDFNNRFLLSRSCTNCHFQVHGSNHPSGVYLTK
jgi:DmsE family decaheme c-type cytochrome